MTEEQLRALEAVFGAAQGQTQGVSPAQQDILNQILGAEQAQSVHNVPAPNPAPEIMTALGHGVANMGTFGHADDILGAMAAATGRSPDGSGYLDYSDPGASFTAMRERAQADLATDRERQPGALLTGELAGGLLGSLGLAKATGGLLSRAIPGSGVSSELGRAAALGGIEGGLLGSGLSNADNAADLAKSTAIGAVAGSAFGPGAYLAAMGVRAVADPFVGAWKGFRGVPYEGRAVRALGATFNRANMTPEEVARRTHMAMLEGQGGFVTADALGQPGQAALSGIARQPGTGAREIEEYLTLRQANQADRVSGFVQDATGANRTAAQTEAAIRSDRRAVTGPMYDAASDGAGPVNLSGVSETLDRALRIDPVIGASSLSNTEMGRRLAALRGQVANGREMLTDFDSVLQVKSDLGRFISENPNLQPIYGQLFKQLDAALEQASPGYRAANDAYREWSQGLDALEAGQGAAGRTRTDDAIDAFRALPPPRQGPVAPGQPGLPDARQAFRTGYADTRLGTIERSNVNRDAAAPFRNDRDEAVMGLLAYDPALFQRRLAREEAMTRTQDYALRGSRTANNTAYQADVNGGGQVMGLLGQVATGNLNGLAADAFRRLGAAGTGLNEETRTLISRVLLSRDPQAEIQRLISRGTLSGEQLTKTQAFFRQLGYATGKEVGLLPQ